MRDLTIRRMNNYPFNFLTDLDSEINDLFHIEKNQGSTSTKDIDIIEKDEVAIISADLPGVKQKDIKLEIKDNLLSLTTFREDVFKFKTKKYGNFTKTFTLDKQYDLDAVETKFEDGVLLIAIPKKEKLKPREVKIENNFNTEHLKSLEN